MWIASLLCSCLKGIQDIGSVRQASLDDDAGCSTLHLLQYWQLAPRWGSPQLQRDTYVNWRKVVMRHLKRKMTNTCNLEGTNYYYCRLVLLSSLSKKIRRNTLTGGPIKSSHDAGKNGSKQLWPWGINYLATMCIFRPNLKIKFDLK